jgi:hypothetical protein
MNTPENADLPVKAGFSAKRLFGKPFTGIPEGHKSQLLRTIEWLQIFGGSYLDLRTAQSRMEEVRDEW